MNAARTSLASACLALLFVGCGGGSGDGSSQGGSGGGAVESGGSGSGGSPGSGGSGSGGKGGGSVGGSGGGDVGGASGGVGSGGTSGNGGVAGSGGLAGSGGAGGRITGGSGGTGKPGTGGSSVGSGGAGSGGAAGSGKPATGGSAGSSTGSGTGTGGSQAGGVQGTGGAGTGGATVTAPALLAVTSSSSAYWKESTPTDSTASADVTVNDTAAQTWEGFGGTFNEKGWSYLTTKALQDEAIGLLFGADGCRFAWGRVPIGASDYAMDRYTLNESKDDVAMSKFSIARDRDKLIPFIKAAQAVKPDLRFWASPWTPPTWMKSNGSFDGGDMKSDDNTMKAFALYLVKFVQEYEKEGIKIEVVAPQNEPNFSQTYPTCLWSSGTYTSFFGKYLGPAIKDAGLDTKIMLGTMSKSEGSPNDGSIVSAVMGDATAKGYAKVIGVQWGMAENIGNYKSYNLPVWVSEHKCGNYPWNPSGYPAYKEPAPNDFAYAKESWGYLRSTIKGGVSSYNAWNMVLDKMGKGIDNQRQWAQNALLVADGGKLTKTPTYYVFRHLSQYVAPGAKVMGTSSNDAIGFKNPDGSVVAVLYAASGKSSYTVALGGKKLQFNMPSDGWATVVYKP